MTFSSLYHPPTILQNVLSVIVATAIAVFCVQLVKKLFFYIYKEVSGAFSGIAYFLIILYMTWFWFSKKIACGHPFHYLLIKIFWSLCTNGRGLPEKKFNLIFNVIFCVALCKSLCISHVPTVFFIKYVLTNFGKFTENSSVLDFHFN